jgi:hypothetical protein
MEVVIPAKAGIHFDLVVSPLLKQSNMDPRFREDDGKLEGVAPWPLWSLTQLKPRLYQGYLLRLACACACKCRY